MSTRTQIVTRDIQDALESESIIYAGTNKKAIWKKISDVFGNATNNSYVHEQNTPASVFVIVHNLGYYPNIRIKNSAGDNIITHIEDITVNTSHAIFDSNNTGTAYCS